MKIADLNTKHIDDIIISRHLSCESHESIGARYGVTGRTIANWLTNELFTDRRKELTVGIRAMTNARLFCTGDIEMTFSE